MNRRLNKDKNNDDQGKVCVFELQWLNSPMFFKKVLFLQTPTAADRKQARIHTSLSVWRHSFPWSCHWLSRWFSTENFSSLLTKRWAIPLVDFSWDQTAIGSKQKMTSDKCSTQDVTRRSVHGVHVGQLFDHNEEYES